jgi:hypothetical protein
MCREPRLPDPGSNPTEQSIEGQLREAMIMPRPRDITVINTYIDRHISGKINYLLKQLSETQKSLNNLIAALDG